MSDSESLKPRSPSRRRVERRSGPSDRRAASAGQNLPAVVDPQPAPKAKPDTAAFAAQVLGQDGQKRGLRGGPEVLNKARSSYLGTEWSGAADRRPPRGLITKTDI